MCYQICPIFKAPVPQSKTNEVALLNFQRVMVCAIKFVPIFKAPVPQSKTNEVAPVNFQE